jgi:hypothetical protein
MNCAGQLAAGSNVRGGGVMIRMLGRLANVELRRAFQALDEATGGTT